MPRANGLFYTTPCTSPSPGMWGTDQESTVHVQTSCFVQLQETSHRWMKSDCTQSVAASLKTKLKALLSFKESCKLQVQIHV